MSVSGWEYSAWASRILDSLRSRGGDLPEDTQPERQGQTPACASAGLGWIRREGAGCLLRRRLRGRKDPWVGEGRSLCPSSKPPCSRKRGWRQVLLSKRPEPAVLAGGSRPCFSLWLSSGPPLPSHAALSTGDLCRSPFLRTDRLGQGTHRTAGPEASNPCHEWLPA